MHFGCVCIFFLRNKRGREHACRHSVFHWEFYIVHVYARLLTSAAGLSPIEIHMNTMDLVSDVIDMDVSDSNRQSMFGGPNETQIGKFERTTTYTNKKISEKGRATICHDGYKKDSTTSKRLPTLRTNVHEMPTAE